MLRRAGFLALAFISSWSASALAEPPAKWWTDDVEQALATAKDNRPELEKALAGVPDQRAGMAFLIANMPESDLHSLKADFLLTNTDLAYRRANKCRGGRTFPRRSSSTTYCPTPTWTRSATPGARSSSTSACRS